MKSFSIITLTLLAFIIISACGSGSAPLSKEQVDDAFTRMDAAFGNSNQAASSAGATQRKPTLAILPFTGGAEGEGEAIATLFSMQAELINAFTVLPRTAALNAIFAEHEFQLSGLTDADTLAKMGQVSNAEYVLSGSMRWFNYESLILFVTIIHVERLEQVGGVYRFFDSVNSIPNSITAMTQGLVWTALRDTRELQNLAILPSTISGISSEDAETLIMILAAEMLTVGDYSILPRSSAIQLAQNERNFQQQGTDAGITAREGKALLDAAFNAQLALSIQTHRLGNNILTVQILNVENGSLFTAASSELQSVMAGFNLMPELARKLVHPARAAARQQSAGMVRIPAGTFMMGDDYSPFREERPQHRVTLNAFYISACPITQREYQEVMGKNPSYFRGDKRPVETVNWFDAIEYCNWRSLMEGLAPAYTINWNGNNRTVSWNSRANGYRLPTEAEWEYACRAGTTTDFNTGVRLTNGWTSENSAGSTQDVGQLAPNAWGLYDMHGNVDEWCWDWYGNYPTYSFSGPASGNRRVVRGGPYWYNKDAVRSAFRSSFSPDTRSPTFGFRVVRP